VAFSPSTKGGRRVISFRPTLQQERWLKLASQNRQIRNTPWLATRTEGWRTATTLTRCAFFILGAFASGLIASILELLHGHDFLLVTGLILVVGAEWLVTRRRFFGVGIEEALELAGLLMIVFQAADIIGLSSENKLSWLVAAVLFAAGLRLLNPLFITLGVVALSYAISNMGMVHAAIPTPTTSMASIFCLSVAGAALFLNGLPFRRPSYDDMLNWLIITMPLAAYLWHESGSGSGLTMDSLRHAPASALLPPLIIVTLGAISLKIGIRRRLHAPIIAFMICIGCVAFELRNLTPLSLKVKLIFWGCAALLLVLGLDRYLRTPRRGITSNQFAEKKGSLDLLQFVGASALAPQTAQQPSPQFKGGGGGGGGGGASGNY
jgi:hypothetical protein